MSTQPWPTAQEIVQAQASDLSEDKARAWSCFDLSDCKHTSRAVVVVGAWEVEVCERCGDTQTTCTHPSSEWNKAGTLLRCTTCGVDGT